MKPLLLIDGDEFLFRAAAAVEQEAKFNEVLGEVDWNEPPIHVVYSHPGRAKAALDEMFERIFDRFKSRDHIVCLSPMPRTNFRYDVDPTYKNHRASSRHPLCYTMLRDEVLATHKCKEFPGLEADDVMGILATTPSLKSRAIIISQDKDMKTIPTRVWRQGEVETISEDEADYWHMYQTLVGDTSDGYKGCPGVGKVKAEKLLTSAEAAGWTAEKGEHMEKEGLLWPRVLHAYGKAMGEGRDMKAAETQALAQARLARILRWTDWDRVKKQPILWSPSK